MSKYNGTIVVLDFRRERVDLIRFKNEEIREGAFDEFLMDLGHDIDNIQYMITSEVRIEKFRVEEGTLVAYKSSATYF